MNTVKENKVQGFQKPISENATLLLVESKIPWYAPNFLVKKGIINAIPDYQNLEGLNRKAFTIGQDGLFGGVYTWVNRKRAEEYYNEDRIKSVEKKRGMRPRLTFFKVLAYKDSGSELHPTEINSKIWIDDFYISIEKINDPSDDVKVTKQFESLSVNGIITKYLVSDDFNNKYELIIWKNEESFNKNRNNQTTVMKTYSTPVLIEGLKD